MGAARRTEIPTTIRYTEKYHILPERTIFTSQMIAPYPTIPARIAATAIRDTYEPDSVDASTSLSLMIAPPATAGTMISRLKPTAQARESPNPSAAAIVIPLRLTPGSGATIWAIPISRAFRYVVSAGPFPLSSDRCR